LANPALLPDEQRLALLDAAARELMGGRFTWSPPPLADHLTNASRVAGERVGLDIAAAILDVVRWWP